MTRLAVAANSNSLQAIEGRRTQWRIRQSDADWHGSRTGVASSARPWNTPAPANCVPRFRNSPAHSACKQSRNFRDPFRSAADYSSRDCISAPCTAPSRNERPQPGQGRLRQLPDSRHLRGRGWAHRPEPPWANA